MLGRFSFAAALLLITAEARAQLPQTANQTANITLPEVLAVEMPRGMNEIGPMDSPLRELLAAARSGTRTVVNDLRRKVGVGPMRVTFSAWNGAPGQGSPVATRTARLFVLPAGMTPVGVTNDENGTAGNNAVHIARDATGQIHMVWQDGGRPDGRTGAVYRRAMMNPDGTVRFETGPIYIADGGPSDWNAYPALAVRGHDVQLVWQGGGTAHTRRVSLGPGGWVMGPITDTGAKSEGRDIGVSIAFDDKGGLHIVTPNGFYGFSADDGKSWNIEPIPLPPNAGIKTQSVTVDSAGVVHVAMSTPITRTDPPGRKLGGYWQLRTIDRTPAGWSNPTDVLANAPGWKERQDDGDLLADWTRIAADAQGALHLAWHGTVFSHKFAHDTAFYAWKNRGGAWSAPVPLVKPDPAHGVTFSYAPSLALDGDRALALVFYDVNSGAEQVGFDATLFALKNGRADMQALPADHFVWDALVAKRPQTAMGLRFPGTAPAVFHGQGGKTWLDVLGTLQSPFEPAGPNLVVYQRLDLTGRAGF